MKEVSLREPAPNAAEELRQQLKFEALLADVSASFVNLPSDQIDANIQHAQQRICECLGFEHATLWQNSQGEPGILLLTHLYRDPSLLPAPDRMDGASVFPWVYSKIRNKEIVSLPNTQVDTPPEAVTDRQTYQAYGVQSTLGFPLWIGDGPVFGVLSFDATTRAREYPETLVKRLHIIAQVFANALARQRTEQALRNSEMRLRLAAHAANAGLWTIEPVSGQMWVTEEAKALFGLGPTEELTLKKLFDLIHAEDRDSVRNAIEEAAQSGEERILEYRINHRSGEIRWMHSRGRRCPGDYIEPYTVMGLTTDITERRRTTEAQIRHSAIVQSSDDAIISMNLEGIIADWNAAAKRTFGYTAEETIGQHINLVVPPELQGQEAEMLMRMQRGERVEHFETVRVRKDGSSVSISLTLSPITDSTGQIVGISKTARDISEAKRVQEELQKSYAEIRQLKEKLQAERNYLQEEIKDIGRFEEIVGESAALRRVLKKVEQVAGTDSVVLITGESGTGKELVARAVHERSARKGHVMVKVDCASLPSTLIESELFGRERGAYTGALTKQVGRVETADGSTLFLDEIGELCVEVQAKLLRVVQDGEFERLGSAKTTHVNVRLIAATHRDLEEGVRKGTFREDLFYRLNVFPIRVPPLRERPEDIPLLVTAFLREFEKKMDKKISTVASKTMDELQRYSWPGNIRELRNVVERAVIVTTGEKLNLQLPKTGNGANTRTLKEAEQQLIVTTLEKTGWQIKGPKGAAAILGMKPSTLYAMMRRLRVPTRHEKGQMLS